MPIENELAVIVRARDAASAVLNKIRGVVRDFGKDIDAFVGSRLKLLKENWLAFSAVVYGALKTIQTAWNWAERAAGFREQMASLDALAAAYGRTADGIVADVQKASKGLIGMGTAASVSAQALMRGLSPEQIVKLAGAAETLSNITGEKVAVAFENLAGAIALGRERALEATVGVIDLESKYPGLVEKMSDAQKAAARYAMVMERVNAIQEALGESADSVSDRMERFQVQVEGIKKTLGEWIIRLAAGLMGTFQAVSALALGLARVVMAPITALAMATDYLGITSGKAEQYKQDMEALADAAEYTAGQAKENFDLLLGDIDQIAPKAKGAAEALKKLGKGGARGESEADLLKRLKAEEDAYRKMQEAASQAAAEEAYARALAITEAKKDEIKNLTRLDEQYRQAGMISEEEFIRRKYDAEKQLLQVRREELLDQLTITDKMADYVKIGEEYGRVAKQIEALEQYQAFELADVKVKKAREQLEVARQLRAEIGGMYLTGREKEAFDLQAAYEADVANMMTMVEEKKATWDQYDAYVKAREYRLAEDLKKIYGTQHDGALGALKEYIDQADNQYRRGYDLFTGTVGAMENRFGDFFYSLTKGGFKFRDFWQGLMDDMLRLASRMIAQMAVRMMASGFGSMFGFSPGGGPGGWSAGGSSPAEFYGAGPGIATALGGIYPGGWMPVKAFSRGGIVRRPTLGLVGEGGQNEAVVPLPDGKAIPVKMSNRGGQQVTINNTMVFSRQDVMAEVMESWPVIEARFNDSLSRAGLLRDSVRRYR